MYNIKKERSLLVTINGKFHFELLNEYHLIPLNKKSSDFFANFASCGEYYENSKEYIMEYRNGHHRCVYTYYEGIDWALLQGSYRAIVQELKCFTDCKVRKGHNYVVQFNFNKYGIPRGEKIFRTKAKALKWAQANCE